MGLIALANPSELAMEAVILLGCGLPLGVGLVVLGLYWLLGSLRITFGGKMTVGYVVRVEKSRGGEGGPTYSPIVRFTEEREGRSIEIDTGFGHSYPPIRYKVGRAVRVLYLPDQPEVARVRSFGAMWGVVLVSILGGLGTLAIMVALVLHDFF
jgi:hypothetical protein